MSYWDNRCTVSEMVGQTFTKVSMDEAKTTITFENDKVKYMFYHCQDCCESVWVEDIIGDLEDLENWPILIAKEETNADFEPLQNSDESYTWTFYSFATYKGYVDIRFYGTSNGFYSESINCVKENKA